MVSKLKLINQVGEWNPQLFRELKGRLKPRNLAIAGAISLFGQFLIYLLYKSLLPSIYQTHSRYCINSSSKSWRSSSIQCIQDTLGNWSIDWKLWWLDIFICISIIGIFALLVVGTYMLISDLSKEESRGTLNFIRLSPQSIQSILTGKMLGVPALLYFVGLLALPLHTGAGLAAHIPLTLILSFYLVLGASCLFFYSTALLYSLVSSKLGGFQAWLGSGALLFTLTIITAINFESSLPFDNSMDLLKLFDPSLVLSYLVNATSIKTGYFDLNDLAVLSWFKLSLWNYTWIGISVIILNYGLWTYWVWQGLKRRFYDKNATLLSKSKSYWFSGSFVVITLGFSLETTNSYRLFENIGVLLGCHLLLFLFLIAALSPHRPVLQDWARYRHQKTKAEKRGILSDLLWGEGSPSTVAIAFNLVITTTILLVGIMVMPLSDYKIPAILGLLLNASVILIYATFAQIMLLMKTKKRGIWSAGTVTLMVVLPVFLFALFRIDPHTISEAWLFSALPIIATEHASLTAILFSMLAQWLAIAITGVQMTRQLRQVGESATKMLLAGQ